MTHLATRPTTREGRRAAWLAGGGLALVPLAALLVRLAGASSDVGVVGLVGVLAVGAAAAYALIAVAQRHDLSVVVLLTLVVGLYALFLAVGETVSIFVESLRH